MKKLDTRIVVIGGGTGSFVLLSGLKKYFSNITALVSMADDGGSTGLLRDEYGVLPAGDVRQCLVALSRSPKVRDLFNYRYSEGEFKGHSFGNLFISTLEKMTGSFIDAIETAGEILHIEGKVVPTTLTSVDLNLDDGKTVYKGESEIREATFASLRPKVWLTPKPNPNPAAIKAIEQADIIVIAPGGLYESLGAALLVPGISETLKKASAKKIYVCNLMNQTNHTDHFTVADYVPELERIAGQKFIDIVIYNNQTPDKKLLKRYSLENESPIEPGDLKDLHYKVIGANLLSAEAFVVPKGDKIATQRALIRHDPDKVAKQIMEACNER